MHYIGLFVSCFVLVYVIYFIFVICRKKAREKLKKSKSMEYFKQMYKIDPNKIDMKEFANVFGIANAFIIALVITIIEFFDSYLIKLLVAIIIMLPVIYVTYAFVGKFYKKKENEKCTISKK
jgi:hypothetical protein